MAIRVIAVFFFVACLVEMIVLSDVPWLLAIVIVVGIAANGYLVGEYSERVRNNRLNAEAFEKAKASVGEARVENDKLIVPIKGINGVPVLNLSQRPVEHGS